MWQVLTNFAIFAYKNILKRKQNEENFFNYRCSVLGRNAGVSSKEDG